MHRPNRVVRQFGMLHSIPEMPREADDLHVLTRQGRRNCDWSAFHHVYVQWWHNRREYVVTTSFHDGVTTTTSDYRRWYEHHSVLFLSPAVRGVGFQTGDAVFRRLVSDEASVLMHMFEGLDVNVVPPDGRRQHKSRRALDDDYM